MNLVVNEWLPEYCLRGAEDLEKQQLDKFLLQFSRNKDTLYVQQNSPFTNKFYRYMKENQQFPAIKDFKRVFGLIFLNPQSHVIVKEIPELPDEINRRLSVGNYESDRYLFETAWRLPENETKIIITTDGKLKTQMDNNGYFEVVLLKDFLKTYLVNS